ncbi:MAG: hypothetical protein ABIR18_14780 [Chitinophagaceae bacterium]
MKGKFLPAILLLFVAFMLAQSCSKKGDPGAPGNTVNVADSFQLVSTDYVGGYWANATGGGGALGITARVATRDVPKITEKIFATGTVLVYMKVPNSLSATVSQWTLLPFTIGSFSTGYLTEVKYTFETGKLRIYYYFERTDAAGAAPPNILSFTIPTYSFRYVIIPSTEGFRSSEPPVDYNDYEAVVKYYNLGK